MTAKMILLPLFVQVALTFGLLLFLFFRRRDDVVNGRVHPSKIALREPNWPAPTLKVAYCFSNQFELPVLFYVLTILELVLRQADFLFIVLAWVFVVSRLVHAVIFTTNNRVIRRGLVYGIGALALIVMWAVFAFKILLAAP